MGFLTVTVLPGPNSDPGGGESRDPCQSKQGKVSLGTTGGMPVGNGHWEGMLTLTLPEPSGLVVGGCSSSRPRSSSTGEGWCLKFSVLQRGGDVQARGSGSMQRNKHEKPSAHHLHSSGMTQAISSPRMIGRTCDGRTRMCDGGHRHGGMSRRDWPNG